MNYVKYMPYHTMINASRNRREITAALEQGFEVKVFSRDLTRDGLLLPDGIRVINDGTHALNPRMPKWKKLALIIKNRWTVYWKTRKLCADADVLSCHDISSLRAAYVATRFMRKKPKLIYDSHEFEIGRNTNRSRFQTWYITHLERFLIKRCAFTITVNDSIADEVQTIHKLKERPVVVRSTPEMWSINRKEAAERRAECEKELGNPKWILMYHGLIGSGRGIEGLIDVVAGIPCVGAVIMGNALTPGYMDEIKHYAMEKGVTQRVYFHPAVSYNILKAYVAAADIGMIICEVPAKSYYFGLPNKFFENIQAETPVITTDLPEMTRIIKKYAIGLTCPVGDTEAAKDCVLRLTEDTKMYALMKENLRRAKEELCWEKEKERLIQAWNESILV